MFTISRGIFSKSLGLADIQVSLLPLLITAPVIVGSALALLKKQES